MLEKKIPKKKKKRRKNKPKNKKESKEYIYVSFYWPCFPCCPPPSQLLQKAYTGKQNPHKNRSIFSTKLALELHRIEKINFRFLDDDYDGLAHTSMCDLYMCHFIDPVFLVAPHPPNCSKMVVLRKIYQISTICCRP